MASGEGRVARWLARQGFAVVAADGSPRGLALSRERAQRAGIKIDTLELDLETEPLPSGPFDVITCFRYLQRDLFPAMRDRLAPGGALVCEIATVRNLERGSGPPARYLLDEGELGALCSPLEIAFSREAWTAGQHLARVIARKSRAPS